MAPLGYNGYHIFLSEELSWNWAHFLALYHNPPLSCPDFGDGSDFSLNYSNQAGNPRKNQLEAGREKETLEDHILFYRERVE